MESLSMDLRERIVAAYEGKEGSYEVLAARFSVSRAVVGKLVRQARTLGTLEPQVHLRGRKRIISGEKERTLEGHDDEVKNLVRNLSRGSLFDLMENVDEHPEYGRSDDFDTKSAEDGIFF